MVDPIALAVPGFFALIGVETFVARRRGVRVYRLADSLTDLSCGVSSQIEAMFFAATQLAVYALVFARFRVVELHGWHAWLVAFVGVDFFYYWWHRASHEVNLLWAAHVVHHQSEDYNLAVALRQSITTGWSALPFYLPLALLGVPPLVFAVTHALSTLYQFWIHTQLVGKVRGPLDWILNLPAHHRVHHAVNAQYLDKNYGATLIVWDRLFGTYVEEEEPCVYGITKPLASFNPLWAQVHYFLELGRRTSRLRGVDRLRVWLASPAWVGTGEKKYEADVRSRAKYDVTPPRKMRQYVFAQYTLLLAATSALMFFHGALRPVPLAAACTVIAAGLVALGGLLESKPWARGLEGARLVASVVAATLVLI
ncbi:MAG TPA: sterol desaturase family protein [Polyangiaceae bacterium]|jgi:sterol desaturase/sphingolipid hydroxylase (fatty acid hydroxylase superfamily)